MMLNHQTAMGATMEILVVSLTNRATDCLITVELANAMFKAGLVYFYEGVGFVLMIEG